VTMQRFIERCEAAARWRESIAARQNDEQSAHCAEALRGAAEWARTDKNASWELEVTLGALFTGTQKWGEEREYRFSTYGLNGPESREHWLAGVRDADYRQ
jgi:hypothetical protein